MNASNGNGADLSYGHFITRALTLVGLVTAVVLLLLLVWASFKIWLLSFAGILLAVFLRGLANWVCEHTPLGPMVSLVVVVLTLLVVIVMAGVLLAPSAVEQFQELTHRLPRAFEEVRARVQAIGWVRDLTDKLPPISEVGSSAGKTVSRLGGVFSGFFEVLTDAVLVLFLGLYLAASPEVYIGGLLHLFPLSKRVRTAEILAKVGSTLRNWLLGQIFSMVVVGVIIGIGLKVIGIPLPIALGVLAGVFDFIPIIGPLMSAVPAVLLGFLISPSHALYVVILFLVVNTVIENHVIVPLVQRYTVSLPPALTMIALVLLGTLFGFLGVLIATPLAATLLVLVKLVYVQDVLGDNSVEVCGGSRTEGYIRKILRRMKRKESAA